MLPAFLDSSTPAKTAFECVNRRQALNAPAMLSCSFSALKQSEGPSSLDDGPSGEGYSASSFVYHGHATIRAAKSKKRYHRPTIK